jgi:PleD family two-component response regulator
MMHSDQCHPDLSHWAIEPLKILAMSPFECMRENICFALDFFAGAVVVDAVDHATACARADRIEPDLIVAHADWPRADALRLAADVRRGGTRINPATPIVMLMWRPGYEHVRTVKLLGIDALVRIPFRAGLLQARAIRVLERGGYRDVFGQGRLAAPSFEWAQPVRPASDAAILTHDEIALLLHPSADNPKVVLPTG